MQQYPQVPDVSDEQQRLFERMQADMQKVNNAANFARQTLFAAVADDAKDSPTLTATSLENGDAYMHLFQAAFDFGMKIEGAIENRVANLAKTYENNPAILKPNRPSIIRPH